MRGAAYAAIALTLIICCPILLGFGLASESTEEERDVVTGSTSLTDYVLNSEDDYMMTYAGPNNNSSLLRHVYAQGQWDSKLIAPDYVSTGTTYSSTPVYRETTVEEGGSWTTAETTTNTNSWSSQTTGTYTNPSAYYAYNTTAGQNGGIEIGNDQYVSWYNCLNLATLGDWDIIRIGMNYTAGPISIRCSDNSISELYNDSWYGSTSSAALVVIKDGYSGFYYVYDETSGTIYNNITWLAIYGNRAQSYGLTYNDTPDVGSPGFLKLTMPKGVPGVVRYTTTSGTYTDMILVPERYTGDYNLEIRYKTLYVGGQNYGAVLSWGVAYLPAQYAATDGAMTMTTPHSTTINARGATSHITFPSSSYIVLSTQSSGSDDVFFQSLETSYQMISDSSATNLVSDDLYGEYQVYTVKIYSYDASGSIVWMYKDMKAIDVSEDVWNMPYSNDDAYSLRITFSDGSPDVYLSAFEGLSGIGKSYTYWSIGSTTYSNVQAVYFAPIMAYDSMTYSYVIQVIDSYADPSYGWRNTVYNGAPYYNDWLNYYQNEYIRMMVQMPVGADLYIKDQYTDEGSILRVKESSGDIFVSWTRDGTESAPALGSYRYIMIELNAKKDEVLVSGISSWPSMGILPSVLNKIRVPYDFDGYIESFTLAVVSGTPTFRVDAANIVAGQFATTKDFTLQLPALWPEDTRQQIYLNSVGVYGTSLTLNGKSHAVTDGRIDITTPDGTGTRTVTVGLNHATIGLDTTAEAPVVTINGYTVLNDGATASTDIVFGGEWSMTLTRQALGTETYTETHWTPGEFALDTDGFVLAMLLTAVGAFVVLGMTGARSGAKVGLLALICGGAVVVGLMMI